MDVTHTTEPLTDVIQRAGVTYRQADFWIRNGHIEVVGGGAGSGHIRVLDQRNATLLVLMGRLTRAGLSVVIAAAVAAAMLDDPGQPIELGEGLALVDLA